jgi:hypothetical protein
MKDKGIGLPMLIEITFERWEKSKKRPNFKAEDFVHKNSLEALEAAARCAAERLRFSAKDSEGLVHRYWGYTRELSGPGVKPVPPFLSLQEVAVAVRPTESCSQSSLRIHRSGSPYLVLHRARAAPGHYHAGGETLARCNHEWFFHDVIE